MQFYHYGHKVTATTHGTRNQKQSVNIFDGDYL